MRIGDALWWYMHVRGLYAEFRELLTPFLTEATAHAQPHLTARLLRTTGVAAWGLGYYEDAVAQLDASLERLEQLGDRAAACQALVDLGCVTFSQGSPRATIVLDQALRLARDLD